MGPFSAGAGESLSGGMGGDTAWLPGYFHASLFVWLQARLGDQGLSSSGAAGPAGNRGSLRVWLGSCRKCSEPVQ